MVEALAVNGNCQFSDLYGIVEGHCNKICLYVSILFLMSEALFFSGPAPHAHSHSVSEKHEWNGMKRIYGIYEKLYGRNA